MEKNKTAKYFKYAIGEIILVVIGILIALSINNWNEHRINKHKETKALTDLLEEFKLNKERIEEKQNIRIELSGKLNTYLEAMSKGTADYNSFQDYHSLRYKPGMTNPSSGVFDALISTGDLSLITNDSLKYLLADWKDQLVNLNENEVILWTISLDYEDYFQKLIPSPKQQWYDWEQEKLEVSFRLLASDTEYRNKLRSYNGAQDAVIMECHAILASIDKTIETIKKELNNH